MVLSSICSSQTFQEALLEYFKFRYIKLPQLCTLDPGAAGSWRCWIQALERSLEWTAHIRELIPDILDAGSYYLIFTFLLISDKYTTSIPDQDIPTTLSGFSLSFNA